MHTIGTYGVALSIEVYIHIDVEEVVTCDAVETIVNACRNTAVPCGMPTLIIKQNHLSFINWLKTRQ